MGYDVNNTTTLLYGYELPIAKLARLPYLTETEAWGERRKCENRVLDWGAVKLRCLSLALMAAERLVGSRTREELASMPMPDAIREQFLAPILAGELLPEQDALVRAAPSPPSKLRFKFDLEDEEGSLGMGEFADVAQHVLHQFAGGPHKGLMPELHLALTYDCMDGGEDARVFLVMPDLTDDWAPCYESVDIVTAVPRERDIDGVARYCFKKVARELLSAVIKPTKKPRFYYVKTATGG